MKPELKGPKVENVFVAAIQENAEGKNSAYSVYLINQKPQALEEVLVSSRGYITVERSKETIRTTTLRKSFGTLAPHSATKVEPLIEEVLKLNNEYLVSFWIEDQLYDKKFVFLPETIKEENFVNVPILNKKGVLLG